MKRFFVLFGLFTLIACDNGDGPEAGGGAAGVKLADLGAYGVGCTHERLAGLVEVQDDLCVPAAPYLQTLIQDCETVAQAGCYGTSDGCAVAAVMTLVGDAYGVHPEQIGANCASSENAFLASTEWLVYFGTIDARPVVGGDVPPQWIADEECVIGVYDQLSPLGQWIYRPTGESTETDN